MKTIANARKWESLLRVANHPMAPCEPADVAAELRERFGWEDVVVLTVFRGGASALGWEEVAYVVARRATPAEWVAGRALMVDVVGADLRPGWGDRESLLRGACVYYDMFADAWQVDMLPTLLAQYAANVDACTLLLDECN